MSKSQYSQRDSQTDNFFNHIQSLKNNLKEEKKKNLIDIPSVHKNNLILNRNFQQTNGDKFRQMTNQNMFKKLADIKCSKRVSNYLSLPYSLRLAIENKNFLANTEYRFKGKKILEDNAYLDRKIKTTKSVYHVDKFEQDFKKSLEFKNLRQRAELKSRSKTSTNFYPELNTHKNFIKIEENKNQTSKKLINIDSGIVSVLGDLNGINKNQVSRTERDKSNAIIFATKTSNKAKELISTFNSGNKNEIGINKSENNLNIGADRSKNKNSNEVDSKKVKEKSAKNYSDVNYLDDNYYNTGSANSISTKNNMINYKNASKEKGDNRRKEASKIHNNLNIKIENPNAKSLRHEFSSEITDSNFYTTKNKFNNMYDNVNYMNNEQAITPKDYCVYEDKSLNDVENFHFHPIDNNRNKTKSSDQIFLLSGINMIKMKDVNGNSNRLAPVSASIIKKKSDYSEIIFKPGTVPNRTYDIALNDDGKQKPKIDQNTKKILYEAKAFIDKLNLVDVILFVEHKKLYIQVNPISILDDRYYLISFEDKEDRFLLKERFKNYQSLVNALYFDSAYLHLKNKDEIIYKTDIVHKSK